MDETEDTPPLEVTDPELRQLLGMFDAPAFARRGQDLEYSLARLRARCRREREAMLDMVRVRLRQWAACVSGPLAWSSVFSGPIDALWPLTGAEPPGWAVQTASLRRRRAVARDLVTSLARFNRRWTRFVEQLDLRPINRMVEHYNHYYILEKECCLGSARLAARHFEPRQPLSPEGLLDEFPTLPVPGLVP